MKVRSGRVVSRSIPVVLQLECASASPGGLVKDQTAGAPAPEFEVEPKSLHI